jgi:hypothetical protein
VLVSLTDDPNHITFTLEGCRNDGSIVLPISGKFVCPDAAYTTGNLGKGWNELDLVPHRVTLSNGDGAQTYIFVVAGDYKNNAATATGWDVISDLTLNSAHSDASCPASPTMGAQTITPSGSGVGGADQTIYRTVTLTQAAGATCVYDYYQRLALGASGFSGSSLQSNLWNQSLNSNGIGQKRIQLPVGEIAPQELSKTMTASQGSDHVWSVTKGPAPAAVSFGNTCDGRSGPFTMPISIKVEWHKDPADPTGPITVVTNVYATNPAARVVTVDLSDDIRSGTTVLHTASAGPTDVPANTANFLLLTHTTTVPDGTTNLNDVATATYTDKDTGIPIPGSTTANASATPSLTGAELNQTATITDSESITGANLTFAVASPLVGSFTGGYTADTYTTGPVGWDSGTQSATGSVTFSKTVKLSAPSIVSGTLSDTATLTGSDGFTASASASTNITSSATVKLTINKNIPNILNAGESASFSFTVTDSGNNVVATPSISFGPGDSSKSVDVSGLAPGSYTVSESVPSGWVPQNDQPVSINLPNCSGSVTFNNSPNTPTARVRKVTDPGGGEAGWTFKLRQGNSSGPVLETVTTTNDQFVNFSIPLSTEGLYTITEEPKAGYDFVSASADCSFTVSLPSSTLYSCTYTNRARGTIIIRKVTNPNPDPSDTSFGFAAGGGLAPSSFSLKNGGSQTYSNVMPGSGYSAAETVPTGWDLVSATCSDGSPVSNINVSAGETVTCTFTNRARGKARVVKTINGAALAGTDSFVFQLRQGASVSAAGTTLESGTANAGNGGVINFSTLLVPGATYQLCEIVMPGWMTTLGPPLYSVFNPSGDNSTVCTDFTVSPGQTRTFAIDNKPPPGGFARTIGFWKNWASCSGSNGGQKPVLDQTLGLGDIMIGDLVLHDSNANPDVASDCTAAVRILNKSKISDGKKMSSDPAFNLAAQLLAAKLNIQAGAGSCGLAATAMNDAQALLDVVNFDGNGHGTMSSAQVSQANSLATKLDRYNNNTLC